LARAGSKEEMRFCFIVEDEYRRQSMPMVIARHLSRSGHAVDLLEPTKTVTALWDLRRRLYDAYILKTVADGPGLCVLEAAEAAGIPTINNSRSIRLVRDKSLCTAHACAHGLPVPHSYFVADPQLLRKIPRENYPLVVKPTNGSSGRGIYLVDSPARSLRRPKYAERVSDFFLVQHYVENPGYDIKLYVIGKDVFAVARESPLHPEVEVAHQLLPLKPAWLKLALRVGEVFGLVIYGLDVLETRHGPMVVDINDFPSFGQVPHAVRRISEYIVHFAKDARVKRGWEPPARRAPHAMGANGSRSRSGTVLAR